MKKTEYYPTGTRGITYRKHPTRKHGVGFDKYFRGQFQVKGFRQTIGFGWASEGWSLDNVRAKLKTYKDNAKKGAKPINLKQELEIEQEINLQKEKEKQRKAFENITFEQFYNDHYLKESYDKKPETMRREKSNYKNWISKYLGDLPIKEIKKMDIEKLKAGMLEKNMAPRTVEYCLAITRQIFNCAIDNEIYEFSNPVSRVKKPRYDNARKRFLTDKEAELLLGLLSQRNQDLYDTALISYDCGLRLGEIFSLKAKDIDLENEIIHLRDTKDSKKGSSSRDAFPTDKVLTMLKARLQGKKPNDLLFPDKYGKKRVGIQKQFWEILEESGLNANVTDPREKIVFHSLRHAFASRLVNKGESLYVVQKLLGHKTLIMTQRYSHLQNKKLKEAANKLNPKEEEPKETPPEAQETPDNVIKFKSA